MGNVDDIAAMAEDKEVFRQTALDIRQLGIDAERFIAERCIEEQTAQTRFDAADFNMAQNVSLSGRKQRQRVIVPNGKPVIDVAATVVNILLRDGLLEVSECIDGVSFKDIFAVVRAEYDGHVQMRFADLSRQFDAVHFSGNLYIDEEKIDLGSVLQMIEQIFGGREHGQLNIRVIAGGFPASDCLDNLLLIHLLIFANDNLQVAIPPSSEFLITYYQGNLPLSN